MLRKLKTYKWIKVFLAVFLGSAKLQLWELAVLTSRSGASLTLSRFAAQSKHSHITVRVDTSQS